MSKNWKLIFKDIIDEREITGEVYVDGSYKVRTTTKSDYSGYTNSDESSFIAIPPAVAGISISIEAENLQTLKQELINDGEFSEENSKIICEKFNK